MALPSSIIQRGTRAAQTTPTAGQAGILYYVTDETKLERWSGTAWENVEGGGGSGTPGGSTTQVQYNNAGAFGGITGATTNGTALTLTAPVLGTPASGTLTNCTGLPTAGLVDDAVTYAKIQNISATQRLLGRNTAGAGDTEEVTPAQVRTMIASGAQVRKAADQTAANYTSSANIAWDQEVYDDNGFHDNVTNNSRLTVPTGVTRVNINTNIFLTSVDANTLAQLFITKNGSADFDGSAQAEAYNNGTSRRLSATCLGVACVATDYFEVLLNQASDTSITVDCERSNFTIQVVAG